MPMSTWTYPGEEEEDRRESLKCKIQIILCCTIIGIIPAIIIEFIWQIRNIWKGL